MLIVGYEVGTRSELLAAGTTSLSERSVQGMGL